MPRKAAHEEILSTARARLSIAIDVTSLSRTNQLEDLKFSAGDSDNRWQWPDDALQTRSLGGQDAVLVRVHASLLRKDTLWKLNWTWRE